jgi:hypothetical protein
MSFVSPAVAVTTSGIGLFSSKSRAPYVHVRGSFLLFFGIIVLWIQNIKMLSLFL